MHRHFSFDQGFPGLRVSSSQLPAVHRVRICQSAFYIVVIIDLDAYPAADPSPGPDDYRGEQAWCHLEAIEAPPIQLRFDAKHLADVETNKPIQSNLAHICRQLPTIGSEE